MHSFDMELICIDGAIGTDMLCLKSVFEERLPIVSLIRIHLMLEIESSKVVNARTGKQSLTVAQSVGRQI